MNNDYLFKMFNRYLRIPWELLEIDLGLTHLEICYFSFLAAQWVYFVQSKKDKEVKGYIYCSSKYVKEKLRISESSQTRSLRKLKKYGWIKTRRVGIPAKNYYKINGVALKRSIQYAQVEHTNRVKLMRHKRININNKTKFNKLNLVEPQSGSEQKHKLLLQRIREEKVIIHWNKKEGVFTHHLVGAGTKTEKILRKYISRCFDKGDKLETLYFAIDAWHSLLLDKKGLKVNFGKKVRMEDLFAPNEHLRKAMRKAGIRIKTPYGIAKKGLPALIKIFSKENKYPEVAEKIEEMFRETNPNAACYESDFRKASEIWVEQFALPLDLMNYLSSLKNIFENIKARSSGLIALKSFWSDTVTGYLIENGFIDANYLKKLRRS